MQIRSIYRMIEMSQGYSGKIATTEAYFYAFDTLPLFIAILVYTPFWPGRFTPRVEGAQRINMDKVELENLQLEAGGSSEYGRNRWAGGSR